MKRFWLSLALCLFCVNSLGAVLYAGAPALDDGGGFISLSPFVDCVFWGVLIAVFGAAALFCFLRHRPGPLRVPRPLEFPAAWLASLAGLSAAILLLGICGLLDPYSPLHLPLWGYVGLTSALYGAGGLWWGRRARCPIWQGLLWAAAITALITGMGLTMILASHRNMAPLMDRVMDGSLFPALANRYLDSPLGAVLARLDLPGCVVMDCYYYAYSLKAARGGILRNDLVMLAGCLCPQLIFTTGWLLGRLRPKRGTTNG